MGVSQFVIFTAQSFSLLRHRVLYLLSPTNFNHSTPTPSFSSVISRRWNWRWSSQVLRTRQPCVSSKSRGTALCVCVCVTVRIERRLSSAGNCSRVSAASPDEQGITVVLRGILGTFDKISAIFTVAWRNVVLLILHAENFLEFLGACCWKRITQAQKDWEGKDKKQSANAGKFLSRVHLPTLDTLVLVRYKYYYYNHRGLWYKYYNYKHSHRPLWPRSLGLGPSHYLWYKGNITGASHALASTLV